MSDRVVRFLWRDAPIRGEIVELGDAWREIVSRHAEGPAVIGLLGEVSAAAVLLSATLKHRGSLILQIHGDGPVALAVAESRADGGFRATVRLRAAVDDDASLTSMVNASGNGRCAVTLDPEDGAGTRNAYQGIVPLEGADVAAALGSYLERSEQTPTRMWLAADARRAVGLMLQRLPAHGAVGAQDDDAWRRAGMLAATLGRDELLASDAATLLHRLFWQEALNRFDARPIRFACRCSRARVAGMLRMLGAAEVESIIDERGEVEVDCEFCASRYRFDRVDCAALFAVAPVAGSDLRQ